MKKQICGVSVEVRLTPPTTEEMTPYTWAKLVELGMATEEFRLAMEENPEPGDMETWMEVAVAEAMYVSRSWWEKLADAF